MPLLSETRGVTSIEVRTGFLGWYFADNHLLSPELTTTTKSPTTNKSKNTCCLTPNHKGSFVPSLSGEPLENGESLQEWKVLVKR